jgi:hypothetical protein
VSACLLLIFALTFCVEMLALKLLIWALVKMRG